jgi:hypothetical protein
VVCKSLIYKVLCGKHPIKKCIICNELCVKRLKGRCWDRRVFPKFSVYGKIGISLYGKFYLLYDNRTKLKFICKKYEELKDFYE